MMVVLCCLPWWLDYFKMLWPCGCTCLLICLRIWFTCLKDIPAHVTRGRLFFLFLPFLDCFLMPWDSNQAHSKSQGCARGWCMPLTTVSAVSDHEVSSISSWLWCVPILLDSPAGASRFRHVRSVNFPSIVGKYHPAGFWYILIPERNSYKS